jgi:hypothetical protein
LEAAVVGLAAAAGQTLFPVPLLGAVLGSLAGGFVVSALKEGLGESASELTARLVESERCALDQLDEKYRACAERLASWFGNLERLATRAFDTEQNTTLLLQASVELAEAAGVPDERIVRTTGDVDEFMG